MDISKLMAPTDEQWAEMSDDERVKVIREGRYSLKQLKDGLEHGSDELRETCQKAKDEADSSRKELYELIGLTGSVKLPDLSRIYKDRTTPLSLIEGMNVPSPDTDLTYAASTELVKRLRARYEQWEKELPENFQPAIFVVLANGITLRVEKLASEGFNGVAITGDINGNPCLIIAHQAALQLFCIAEPVTQEEQRKPIGFIIPSEPAE